MIDRPRLARAARALKENPLPLVFAIVSIGALVPLWGVLYQPMPDLGNHLAAVSILRHYHDPQYDFERYYVLNLTLVPYWGYYAATYLLSFLFGLSIANRIVLSFCAVGMPLGFAFLARRFGRSPWLALFTFPLAWNFNFVAGFIPFCVGLAALPYALLLFDRFCERPTWGRGVAAAVVGALMYFGHLLPWGMYVASSGLIGLLHEGRSWKRIGGRFAVWSVGAVSGVLLSMRSTTYNLSHASHGIQGQFLPWKQLVTSIHAYVIGTCRGHEDDWLAYLLLGGWLLLFVTAPWRWKRPRLHDLRAEACFVTATTAYFVLPYTITAPMYWWAINVRFAAIAALFLALCIPGAIVGWRRLLLVPVLAGALGVAIDQSRHWFFVENYIEKGFRDLAPLPGPGKRVQFLVYPPLPGDSARWAFPHAPVYQAYYGGYNPWMWEEFPIRFRVRYPSTHFWSFAFDWNKHARYWDYLMVFQMGDRQLFKGHESEVKLIAQSGRWQLWKLPGPREDKPPAPPYPSGWEYQ